MKKHRKQFGFSLTEMLIATGIMAIGLVMVATIFPVGVKLTTLTTERTVGSVVADEAFAKIQLYGLRDFQYWPSAQINLSGYSDSSKSTYEFCDDYQYTYWFDMGLDGFPWTSDDLVPSAIDSGEAFRYPSSMALPTQDRNYHWSALCRRVGAKDVQVTVFVTRKIAASSKYRAWDFDPTATPPAYSALLNSPWPTPVPVNVTYSDAFPNTLFIPLGAGSGNDGWDTPMYPNAVLSFFDDGYTIVDGLTGKTYRLLEVKDVDDDGIRDIVLSKDWQWEGYPVPIAAGYTETRTIWVVPPAMGSDRYPCVGVYQKTIYFEDIN